MLNQGFAPHTAGDHQDDNSAGWWIAALIGLAVLAGMFVFVNETQGRAIAPIEQTASVSP